MSLHYCPNPIDETAPVSEEAASRDEDSEGRIFTLKALTGAVMSLIECGNRATRSSAQSPRARRSTSPAEEGLSCSPATNTLNNRNSNNFRTVTQSIRGDGGLDEKGGEEKGIDEQFQTENNYENYVNYFKNRGILFPRSALYSSENETPLCYDKNLLNERHNNINNNNRQDLKLNLNLANRNKLDKKLNNLDLNEIIEECEYDSDIGKFSCNNLKSAFYEKDSEVVRIVDDNLGKSDKKDQVVVDYPINVNESQNKVVTKKIEYFENKVKPNSIADNKGQSSAVQETTNGQGKPAIDLPTYLCLGTLFMTIIMLYFFPLPN